MHDQHHQDAVRRRRLQRLSTQITYTYVVTNDSDFYSVSGSVSDDQFGSVGVYTAHLPPAPAQP